MLQVRSLGKRHPRRHQHRQLKCTSTSTGRHAGSTWHLSALAPVGPGTCRPWQRCPDAAQSLEGCLPARSTAAHHAAQLAILFKLEAAVAVAAQDDCVVLLHRRRCPAVGRCAAAGQVLPPPRAGLLFQQHCCIVVACANEGTEWVAEWVAARFGTSMRKSEAAQGRQHRCA